MTESSLTTQISTPFLAQEVVVAAAQVFMAAMNSIPEELIVQFYSVHLKSTEQSSLDWFRALRDRLRGMAVCKSWCRALRRAPLARLDISSNKPAQLVEWVICTQPRVQSLAVVCELEDTELGMLLGSLPRQDLLSLEISRPLPCPLAFPNLTSLDISRIKLDHPSLHQLSRLQHLQELSVKYNCADQPEDIFMLPRLEHITALRIASFNDNLADNGEDYMLRVALSDLPSLLELRLDFIEGWVKLAASNSAAAVARAPGRVAPAPSRLSYLYLGATNAVLDFAAMPSLSRAELVLCEDIDGLQTLAAATSLTALNLGDYKETGWCCDLGEPWVAQVLRCAPTSLRRLALVGDWGQEVAGVLGSVAGLRVLELLSREVLPLPGTQAPVWRGLRALKLICEEYMVGVPEGLVHASQLEWLELGLMLELQPQHARRLAAIPSLRHLWVELDNSDPHFEEGLAALRASMPRLESLRGRDWSPV